MTVIQVYPVTEDKLTPTYKQNPENENEYELQTVGLESSSKAGSSGRKDKIEDNVSKDESNGYSFWSAHSYLWCILTLIVILTIIFAVAATWWIRRSIR